jgi:tRNA(Glu) U13 pseudouridine synthase TruD
MKECTLKEAIELCERNGGKFWAQGFATTHTKDEIPKLKFDSEDIKATWIYEPPKSAFQEWNAENRCKEAQTKTVTEIRKEGWDAALEAIRKWLSRGYDQGYQSYVTDKIQQLKED